MYPGSNRNIHVILFRIPEILAGIKFGGWVSAISKNTAKLPKLILISRQIFRLYSTQKEHKNFIQNFHSLPFDSVLCLFLDESYTLQYVGDVINTPLLLHIQHISSLGSDINIHSYGTLHTLPLVHT